MTASAFYRLAGRQIRDLVQPCGFKKSGRFFYRITEEGVIQQFCMLWLHRAFTLRFYLSSVYGYHGRNIEGAEIFEITNGSHNQWLSDARSGFERTADNPVSDAAEICTRAVADTLLPFFESHRDPDSARAFIVSHEPRILSGTEPYDIRELGLFLSLGDLDSARDFLVHYIENSDRYNQNWWREAAPEYHRLLDAICSDDAAYLSAYMEDKKNAAFAEYKWRNR